jgi:hypothetical protein
MSDKFWRAVAASRPMRLAIIVSPAIPVYAIAGEPA